MKEKSLAQPILHDDVALPSTRLGPYEVTAPIGEGGMGAVYRATDTGAIYGLEESPERPKFETVVFLAAGLNVASVFHP